MQDLETKLFEHTRSSDETMGIYSKAVAAQAKSVQNQAQDGGVVTALLVQRFKDGDDRLRRGHR